MKMAEFPYTPQPVFPVISILHCMVRLSQLVNQYGYITIHKKISFIETFRFPSFLPNELFLFQDLIQGITSCLVGMSPWALLGRDSFRLLVFDDFSVLWIPGQTVPQEGLDQCFSQDQAEDMGLGKKDYRDAVPISSHQITLKGCC